MIKYLTGLPFWWQFAVWITAPYIGAAALYALKNVVVCFQVTGTFGFNVKNRLPVIKSSLFKGFLYDLHDDWLQLSLMGLGGFSLLVILFKSNTGVIKWGYIGSLIGLIINSAAVFFSQGNFHLTDNYILPKIENCLEEWKASEKEKGRLKTISIGKVLKLLADRETVRSTAEKVLKILDVEKEQYFHAYIDALEVPESENRDTHITAAIEALTEFKDERAFDPILKKLEDVNARLAVRSTAIKALARMNPSKAFAPVVSRLNDESSHIRATAAKVLGQMGYKRAVKALTGRLDDSENDVRAAVITALTEINPVKAFDHVLPKLNDEACWVRSTAVEMLGRIGDKRAIEPLLEKLSDNYDDVRTEAANTLEILGATHEQRLKAYIYALQCSTDAKVKEDAIKALHLLNDKRAIEPLLEQLGDKEEQVRSAVVEALERIGAEDEQWVTGYIAALKIPKTGWNDKHIEAAIGALAKLKNKHAFIPLQEKVEDINLNADIRAYALKALAVNDPVSAFDYVSARLDDQSPVIREAAASALGEIKDERAITLLENKIDDTTETDKVRSAAITALAEINPGKAFGYVLAKLNDVSSEIRTTAAKVLGRIGDKRAVVSLENLLAHTWESSEEVDYGPYGEEWTYTLENPEYKAIKEAIETIGKTESPAVEDIELSPSASRRLNVELTKKIIANRKIDIKKYVNDLRLRNFLTLLKHHYLTDIVVVGGVIRDILFGLEMNDIDISIKMELTADEIESFTPLNSYANERVYAHAKELLNGLAQQLNIDPDELLPPSKGCERAFQGLNVDYFGPVVSVSQGKTVIMKRSVFDSVSRRGFFSNTGAAILRTAIDADGNFYGDTGTLDYLLKGRIAIYGDGSNFGIVDILKLLRLKHQFDLTVDSAVYSLIKQKLARFKSGNSDLPVHVVEMIEKSTNEIINTAHSADRAQKELRDLGLLYTIFSFKSASKR